MDSSSQPYQRKGLIEKVNSSTNMAWDTNNPFL